MSEATKWWVDESSYFVDASRGLDPATPDQDVTALSVINITMADITIETVPVPEGLDLETLSRVQREIARTIDDRFWQELTRAVFNPPPPQDWQGKLRKEMLGET